MKLFTLLQLVAIIFWAGKVHGSDHIAKIESTYQNLQSLQADFIQKTEIPSLKKRLEHRGTFFFKKPGMFRLDYQPPHPKQYMSQGQKIWIYIPGDHQVEVYDVDNPAVPREAIHFLTHFSQLSRYYQVKVDSAKHPSLTRLHLIPRRKTAYTSLDCHFNADHLLSKVTITYPDDRQTTYSFQTIKIDPPLSDDHFIFAKPGIREIK